MSLRCLFGFHAWVQSRYLVVADILGTAGFQGLKPATRMCKRCGRVEGFVPSIPPTWMKVDPPQEVEVIHE